MKIATCHGSGSTKIHEIFDTLDVDYELEFIHTPTQAKSVAFDRLLLLGGTDIHPRYYGQSNRHCMGKDNLRDAMEWVLARRALSENKPTLGICRGHQMLTIAGGGTLHQDMYAENVLRRDARHGMDHEIEAYDDLAWVPEWVNSYHHQCTANVPPDFEIAAMSYDGVIEAIYKPGYLGVQWHPEMMWEYEEDWLLLFEWFTYGLR